MCVKKELKVKKEGQRWSCTQDPAFTLTLLLPFEATVVEDIRVSTDVDKVDTVNAKNSSAAD